MLPESLAFSLASRLGRRPCRPHSSRPALRYATLTASTGDDKKPNFQSLSARTRRRAPIPPTTTASLRGKFKLNGNSDESRDGRMPPPLYRLIYFDLRGIVEPVRLLLALAGAQYEDVRYPMRAAASGFAPDKTYLRDKALGKFAANMNSLPILQILEDDGSVVVSEIGQSAAILRFLARKHGLCGLTELAQAAVDAICEHVRDVKQCWYKCKKAARQQPVWCGIITSAEEPSPKDRWFADDLPRMLKAMEAALPAPEEDSQRQPRSPWLVGSATTVADIAVYHLLATPQSVISGSVASFFDGESDRVRDALEVAPRIQASVHALGRIDAIQQWEFNRPDTFS